VNKKIKNARTKIADLNEAGFELGKAELALVFGGEGTCSAPTPYEVSTGTMNSAGMPDTQTDCTSKAPLTLARIG